MNHLIKVQNLEKEYILGKDNTQQVLRYVDLTIQEGEFISVMGASGSGKSTLLYNISGMDKPTGGHVLFDETDISTMPEDSLAKFRLKKMGFIFQQNHFLKNLNIIDNIVLPAYLNKHANRQAINTYAKSLMEQIGILELKDKDITQVSGGQLQRASICRALINSPQILFGDEPTGALNSKSANDVMETFLKVNAMGTTIMLVTHDTKVASKTERVLFMSDGAIVGNLNLGKYSKEHAKERESRLSEWLLQHDF